MGSHPIMLGLRFLLELAAMFSLGYWGWTQHGGGGRVVVGIGLPLAAAVAWGVFRVPGDGGPPVVPIPGWRRLFGEIVLFGLSSWAVFASGARSWGLVFAFVSLLHHALSYDRIAWLLRQR